MPKNYGQACPVAKTLELIGDRWTLLVVRDLLMGKTKFAELLESLPGLAPNILSDRLKHLEASGIIEQKQYNDHPPRVEYKLTASGRELGLVVGALFTWGSKHLYGDLALVDEQCGHEVGVAFYCPECERPSDTRRMHRKEKKTSARQ